MLNRSGSPNRAERTSPITLRPIPHVYRRKNRWKSPVPSVPRTPEQSLRCRVRPVLSDLQGYTHGSHQLNGIIAFLAVSPMKNRV